MLWGTGQLHVWDLESGELEELRAPESETVGARCVTMRPIGDSPSNGSSRNILAAGIGLTVEIWDVDQRRQLAVLRGHDYQVDCVAFDRDGSRLFSGDEDGVVKVWNVESREELLTFKAHESNDEGA